MRTTTNEFKSKVQQHIIERLGNPWNNQTQSENENATTVEKLTNVIEQFKNWWCPYEMHRNPNQAQAFKDFLQGLPSCLNAEYTYYDQRRALREWHEQSEAESNKYTDEQVEQNYYWLIYREFCTLCKKNNIEF